jgi:hypothetical protein
MTTAERGNLAVGDSRPGFIRELCVALEHRWKPDELFLIFTAYFDESDSHGPSPNLIVAGFMASARDWELFGRRLRDLQRRYGFKTLHAKDFRARRGEFEGWSIEKCCALLDELAVAIRDNLKEGFSALLPRTLYEAEFLGASFPKGMHKESQYGLCFRVCLWRLLQILVETKKRHRLHIVVEDGHKNVRDTVRVFNEVKAEFLEDGLDILGTITIAKKAENDLLMIADFQAHTGSVSEANLKVGKPGYYEMAAAPQLMHRDPIKSNEAALIQFEFTPQTLRDIKRQWQETKDRREMKWRAARDAKRALAASEKEQPS